MWVGFCVTALVWVLAGLLVRRYPETLSGYNTMSAERRKLVDIRAAGRFVSRLLFGCAVLLAFGALLPERWAHGVLWAAVVLLLGGALWSGRRYDFARSVRRVRRGKRRYLPLLLIGDESEELIDGYLERCDLWVCRRGGEAVALCAVTDEGSGDFEIRNLAVASAFRRRGYGSRLLTWIGLHYARRGRRLVLGTGETPSVLAFYRSCGFVPYGREEGYFTRAYDHPIVEEGVVLRDRILLRKKLEQS